MNKLTYKHKIKDSKEYFDNPNDPDNQNDSNNLDFLAKNIPINLFQICDLVNPDDITKNLITAYVNLDSANLPITFGNGPLTWQYNRSVYNIRGSVSSLANLGNIMYMKIQDCTIPNLSSYTLNNGNRIGILIEEFKPQSFIYLTSNLHFIGEADLTFNPMQISFYNFNRGDYHFTRQITQVNTLTLRVFNPFTELTIPNQYRFANFTVGSNPMTITFTTPHNFTNATTIIISGFASNVAATNALVNTSNTLTVVNTTTITIPVDISGCVPTVTYITTNYERFHLTVPLQFNFYYTDQT